MDDVGNTDTYVVRSSDVNFIISCMIVSDVRGESLSAYTDVILPEFEFKVPLLKVDRPSSPSSNLSKSSPATSLPSLKIDDSSTGLEDSFKNIKLEGNEQNKTKM